MKRSCAMLTMWFFVLLGLLAEGQPAPGQPPASPGTPGAPGRGGGRGGPSVVSPQIEPDGRVTFRVLAPDATTVTVGGDINGSVVPDPAAPTPPPPGAQAVEGGGVPAVAMTKGGNGIWSGTTVRRVKPGAWRYTFNIDGVTVVDSRNVHVSPSQTHVQR